MSEIKSLEELRKFARNMHADDFPQKCSPLQQIADAIEAEIAERFIELPVDADGVPIHIGDRLLKSTGAPTASYGEVVGISDDSVWFAYESNGYQSNWANLTRHVYPDTVESLLEELVDNQTTACSYELRDVIAEYAGKIRELLKEDA